MYRVQPPSYRYRMDFLPVRRLIHAGRDSIWFWRSPGDNAVGVAEMDRRSVVRRAKAWWEGTRFGVDAVGGDAIHLGEKSAQVQFVEVASTGKLTNILDRGSCHHLDGRGRYLSACIQASKLLGVWKGETHVTDCILCIDPRRLALKSATKVSQLFLLPPLSSYQWQPFASLEVDLLSQLDQATRAQ